MQYTSPHTKRNSENEDEQTSPQTLQFNFEWGQVLKDSFLAESVMGRKGLQRVLQDSLLKVEASVARRI